MLPAETHLRVPPHGRVKHFFFIWGLEISIIQIWLLTLYELWCIIDFNVFSMIWFTPSKNTSHFHEYGSLDILTFSYESQLWYLNLCFCQEIHQWCLW